jgi:hypothetical protein
VSKKTIINRKLLTVEDFLDAPIDESDPECQENIDEVLRNVDGVPFLAVLLTILKNDEECLRFVL